MIASREQVLGEGIAEVYSKQTLVQKMTAIVHARRCHQEQIQAVKRPATDLQITKCGGATVPLLSFVQFVQKDE